MFGWLLGAAWLALLITAHRLFLTIRRARTGQGVETSKVVDEGCLP